MIMMVMVRVMVMMIVLNVSWPVKAECLSLEPTLLPRVWSLDNSAKSICNPGYVGLGV